MRFGRFCSRWLSDFESVARMDSQSEEKCPFIAFLLAHVPRPGWSFPARASLEVKDIVSTVSFVAEAAVLC